MRQKRGLKGHDKVEAPAPETGSAGVTIMETEPVGNGSPSHDDIAVLAYSYWEARGYQDGDPEIDWLRAEQELRARGKD